MSDSYLQKIVEIIPVEIVGGYLLALQLASGVEQGQRAGVLLIIFVGGFALTYGSMVIGRGLASPKHWGGKVTNRDRAEIGQVIFALIAYCLWAYLQGGVFAQGPMRETPIVGKDLWPYSPVLGTLAIIAVAIAMNWFKPAKKVDPATK